MSVVAGEAMRVTCPVGGYPIEAITWDRGKRSRASGCRTITARRPFTNGTLVVQDVERATDEGLYSCTARNRDGLTAHNTVYIKVLGKRLSFATAVTPLLFQAAPVRPAIVPFSFPESLHQGQRYNVLCTVSKGDAPVHITWYKDGVPVSTAGLASASVLNVTEFSSTLIFEKLLPEHRGNYSCEARNEAGGVTVTSTMATFPVTTEPSAAAHESTCSRMDLSPSTTQTKKMPASFSVKLQTESHQVLSKVVKLSVHVAAHFKSKFKAESVQRGHIARLRCEAFGDKPVIITWSRDKQSFDPKEDPRYELNETVHGGGIVSEITIRGADRRDSALFTCLARNAYGSDDTNMQLILQEPPDSPQEVKLLEYGSRHVKLSWITPYSGNSAVTKYIIQYREDTESWHHKSSNVTVPGSETTAEIRGLRPVTLYVFRIFAFNSLGHSDASTETHVRTDVEAPGGPPQKVRAEATGSQSIKVWWKPPRKDLQFGPLKGYYVGYKVKDTTETYVYKTLELTPANLHDECHITNLKRNTDYSVVVQAFNAKGAGPPSEEIFVKTLKNDPPTSPAVKVQSSTSSSISVSWKASDTNDVMGYVLHVRKDLGEWNKINVPRDAAEYTVDQAHINIISAKTIGVAPVAPDKPSLITINSTSIAIHLDSWHDGGCPFIAFEVRFRRQKDKVWNVVGHNSCVQHFNRFCVAAPATPSLVVENEATPFYFELGVILPACISLIVVLVVGVLVYIVLRKRYSSDSSNSGSSAYGSRKGTHLQECLHLSEVDPSLGKKTMSLDGRLDYYPTPYATTRVSDIDERKMSECSYKQAQEEPLYATVKRTPRPPRSDIHVYNYPVLSSSADVGDRRASSSHWKMATAVVKLDDGPEGLEVNHSPSKRSHRMSHR
ncbi:hypothetical protein MRX96_036877 [Rhipicephalus microplus]